MTMSVEDFCYALVTSVKVFVKMTEKVTKHVTKLLKAISKTIGRLLLTSSASSGLLPFAIRELLHW